MYALPSTVPYIDLLPGPFLLLIFIPLLPLALFSLGARPPTGSSLDFLTEELWRTTALLGVAVTVALCVGVYPGSMEGVTSWVKEGNWNFDLGIGGSEYLAIGKSWFGAGSRSARGVVGPAGRRVVRRAKPSFERVATNHIAALRYYYPRAYNASIPKPASVLGFGILITLVTIVITGKVLQGMYDSDSPPSQSQERTTRPQPPSSSKKPSAWVTKEYESRKKEKDTPDVTKKRFKEEEDKLVERYEGKKKELDKEGYEKYIEGKSRERDKDLGELKKTLEKKGIEPVGLDKLPKWYIKPKKTSDDGKKEAEKANTKVPSPGPGTGSGTGTMADKIKSALLGKTLSAARKKDKQKRRERGGGGGQAVVMAPRATAAPSSSAGAAAMPARGPGWEVSQDPSTAVGLAKSAGNAEALARGLGR